MSFDRQPILLGELLELRPLHARDFEALFQVAADPLIWEQHPERNRYQEAVFRAFFDEALTSGGALVALDRANGHTIGSSRYHGYDAERSVIEIGWSFLARAYWGGRYNGEMKRLMAEHAFRSVARVIFIIGPDNRRSQRAVEKIGGVRTGTTTDPYGRERVVYELTPALSARAQGSVANIANEPVTSRAAAAETPPLNSRPVALDGLCRENEPLQDTWSLRLTGSIDLCAAVNVACPDQHLARIADPFREPGRIPRRAKKRRCEPFTIKHT